MTYNAYKKPSSVLIDSYNSKVLASFTYPLFELVSWSIVDNTTPTTVTVNAVVTDGSDKQTTAKRYDLSKLFDENDDGYALIDPTDFETLANSQFSGGVDGALAEIRKVTAKDYVGTVPTDLTHERVLGILWVTKQLYIPITEVTLNNILLQPYVTLFDTKPNTTVYDAYEITAKNNSLGFVGSTKIIIGVSDSNEGGVEPEVIDPPVGGMKFRITSPDTLAAEGAFKIKLNANPTQWALHDEDNRVIATSEFQAENVSVTTTSQPTISITNLRNSTQTFTLVATVNTVEVIDATTAYRNVDILEFADSRVTRYAFSVYNSTLTVPEQLPAHITTLRGMFYDTYNFNQDISMWDTSRITSMELTFSGVKTFNQNISGWDTSSVTSFKQMFMSSNTFNQDISGWNVSNATTMEQMFSYAKVFNQDLSNWCVTNIATLPNGFDSGTTAWTLPKPVWGTCPRGENTGT